MSTELENALRERDAYFADAARTKDTLALVIPALEKATGLKAEDFHGLADGEMSRDEMAALWLARAILEGAP